MASRKYYVVLRGKKTGIFTTWKDCEAQVKGFSGAVYKSFKTKEEAEAALSSENLDVVEQVSLPFFEEEKNKSRPAREKIASESEFIMDSICVDASCIGNPGVVEYRGVYTATNSIIFHKSPMSHGTNNLGEFLAIVHALAYLKNQAKSIPIYSDSATAILWVKNKKVRTKLKQSSDNEEIFQLTERALRWLENNEYDNPILKWNTQAWGEIPADFGRK